MQFRNDYWFLSNFYPVEIECCNLKFRCVESAFQAYKCADPKDRLKFVNLNGADAKKLGREIKMRDDWNDIKDYVMYRLVYQKFNRNRKLALMLGDIESEIVEDNGWNDTYWGVCKGKGLNKLGKILMKVRKDLDLKPLKTPTSDDYNSPEWNAFNDNWQILYGRSYFA